MTAPRDLIPLAMLALATLVGVGVIVVLGELLRRAVLYALSALLPPAADPAARSQAKRADGDPEGS
jgi:hypothetical protein